MTTAIIHLSDFHNVKGKYENHPVVVSSLFADLRKQIDQLKADDVFLAFTGDVAQSGDESDQYADFKEAFHNRLCEIGIPKNRRIFVPGNHDLSRQQVAEDFVVHEAVVSQDLTEKAFNDFVLKAPNILTAKFKNYSAFQQDFCDFGIAVDKVTGAGWDLTDGIGVYCLNTALCSSGGLERDGRVLSDKRRLRIDTRSLHQWLQTSKSKWKILLMHHPLHWLAESSEKELKVLLRNHFALRLYGHEHEQDAPHSIDDGKSLLECCSPALFSRKSDQLGYAIVTVDKDLGPREISYRQWTKQHVFVSGTAFSGTDNGKVNFHKNLFQQIQPATVDGEDAVLRYLTRRLDKALISFSGQPKVWVDPIVKTTPEVNKDAASTEAFDFNELLDRPVSTLIHALPQFGLTCLAHHLAKRAWEGNGHLWLYLDAVELKPTSHAVKEAVALELSEVGLTHSEIKCVVLDSIGSSVKDAWKILSKVTANFPGIPVICMHTLDPTIFSGEASGSSDIPTGFQNLYVWTLPRNLIREIVADYNDSRHVGDENQVIKRLVADLEMLNLHRTPLNCLTLLKVSELDFDESPVNRSEVIKRVLFLLFNVDSLPSYKARPDLKDCEYVIGYFCETMLKTGIYTFSRTHFMNVLQQCCRERFIELEIHVVFDVLSANNILVVRDGQFAFKEGLIKS
ncbi:metallophosphoesterase family protein [Polaromonas sp.]|uniref:metallophosphoesterase family protein n=1 Tax=Polaromonas sp. TaxID=1869339 RepID=UPI00375121AF